MNIKIQNLKFEEAAKIKEEIDLFSAIVKKQKISFKFKQGYSILDKDKKTINIRFTI